MGTSVGTVTADFDARSAKFAAELEKVRKGLFSLQKDVRGINQFLSNAARTFASVISAGAIFAFVKSAADAQEKLLEMGRAVSVASTNLKALQLVTSETGGNVGALTNVLFDAQKRLGEAAAGTGQARKVIQALGLDVQELRKLSPDQLFLRYADAIATIGDRNQQIAASNALFGKSAKEVINTIRAGRPAFEEAAAAVERLGLVLRPEQVALIDQAGDAFGRVRDTTLALGARLAASVAPFVLRLSETLLGAAGSADKVQAAIDALVDTAFVGLSLIINSANTLKAAFFGVAGALSALLAAHPSNLFTDVGASLRAAAAENFAAAEEALRGVKSLEQIKKEILEIRGAAEGAAAAASSPLSTGFAGGFGLDLGAGGGELDHLQLTRLTDDAVAQATRAARERDLEEFVEFGHRRFEAERESENRRLELIKETEATIEQMRESAVNQAVTLLNLLGQRNKAAAIAAILISKATAIVQTLQASRTAAILAYASQLVPGDPSSILRAKAAYATTLALGKLNAVLIGATGALEIANVVSGDRGGIDGSGLGTPSNPLPVAPTGADAQGRSVTTIVFQGPVAGEDAFIEIIERAVNNRGVVVIRRTSAQAAEIRGE